jgi:hypothetical protein
MGTNWRTRSKWITGAVSILETGIAVGLAYMLFLPKTTFVPLTIGILFSLIPDWLEAPWYILYANRHAHGPSNSATLLEKLSFQIYKQENRFHRKAQFPLGLVTQIVTVAFFLLILLS